MTRDVDLVSYFPPYLKEYKEPVAIMEAENREFTMAWNASDQVLSDEFIATANEYGIGRYETILGIHPDEEDDLETRRLRVQSRWFATLPYTIRTFTQAVERLLGETYNFSLWSDFGASYEMILTVYAAYDSQVEELKNIISSMVPANIVVSIVYEDAYEGTVYYGAVADEADIIEIIQR